MKRLRLSLCILISLFIIAGNLSAYQLFGHETVSASPALNTAYSDSAADAGVDQPTKDFLSELSSNTTTSEVLTEGGSKISTEDKSGVSNEEKSEVPNEEKTEKFSEERSKIPTEETAGISPGEEFDTSNKNITDDTIEEENRATVDEPKAASNKKRAKNNGLRSSYGYLNIYNSTESGDGDPYLTFDYEVKIWDDSDPEYGPYYMDLTEYGLEEISEKEGTYKLTLNRYGSFYIGSIPFGYKYEIYELDENGNVIHAGDSFNDEWNLITEDANVGEIDSYDIYVYFDHAIKTGDLTIRKRTINNEPGQFRFTIKMFTGDEPMKWINYYPFYSYYYLDNIFNYNWVEDGQISGETVHIHKYMPNNGYEEEYMCTGSYIDDNGYPQYIYGEEAENKFYETETAFNRAERISEYSDYIYYLDDFIQVYQDLFDDINDRTGGSFQPDPDNMRFDPYSRNVIVKLPLGAIAGQNIGEEAVDYFVYKVQEDEPNIEYLDLYYWGNFNPTGNEGEYEFWLYDGESIELNSLPVGYKWVIKEDRKFGWEQVGSTNATGKIKESNAGIMSLWTNKKKTEETITVEKTWDDEDDLKGFRPDDLELTLVTSEFGSRIERTSADATIDKVSDENKWIYSWTVGIDEEVTDIYEEIPPYYRQTVEPTLDEETGIYRLTNTLNAKEFVVEKTWDDNYDTAGKRPDDLDITLKTTLNGREITRTAADAEIEKNRRVWRYTFFVENDEVYRSFTETLPEGYSQSRAPALNTDTGFYELTNSLDEPVPNTITVTKTWIDEDDSRCVRPKNLPVTVQTERGSDPNTKRTYSTADGDWVKNGDTWTCEITPEYSDEIVISVDETLPGGYAGYEQIEEHISGNNITLVNNYRLYDLTITKETVDNEEGEFDFFLRFGHPDTGEYYNIIKDPVISPFKVDNDKLTPGSRTFSFTTSSLLKLLNIPEDKDRIDIFWDPVNNWYMGYAATNLGVKDENYYFKVYKDGVTERPDHIDKTWSVDTNMWDMNTIDYIDDYYREHINGYDEGLTIFFKDGTYYNLDIPAQGGLSTYHYRQMKKEFSFKLKNGESVTIPNIPYGYTYEVWEGTENNRVRVGGESAENFRLKSMTNASGTIDSDISSLFVNEIKKGKLKVTKNTDGKPVETFSFKVKAWKEGATSEDPLRYFDFSAISGVSAVAGEEGTYRFNITTAGNTGSFELPNIPYGFHYEIWEETKDNWKLVSVDGDESKTRAEGVIESENVVEIPFVNNALKMANLRIQNITTDPRGDAGKTFDYEVKIWKEAQSSSGSSPAPAPAPNALFASKINRFAFNPQRLPGETRDAGGPTYMDLSGYGEPVPGKDGTFKVTIDRDDVLTIKDIPYGYKYAVKQLDSNGRPIDPGNPVDYQWNLIGEDKPTGDVLGFDVTASFTNELKKEVHVTVVWDDYNNESSRPDDLSVTINTAGGVDMDVTKTYTATPSGWVKSGNQWTYVFYLDDYDEVLTDATEVTPLGYELTASAVEGSDAVFTNSLLSEIILSKTTVDDEPGRFIFKIDTWIETDDGLGGATYVRRDVDFQAVTDTAADYVMVRHGPGEYLVTIPYNDSITISGLLPGMKYKITELRQSGWELINSANDEGFIESASVEASFENKKSMKDVILRKTWNDDNNSSGSRPDDLRGYIIADSGEVYGVFDSDERSLTFFYDDKGKYTNGQVIGSKTYYTDIESVGAGNTMGWDNVRSQIETVNIDCVVKPGRMGRWFADMTNLTTINGMTNMDTSNCDGMGGTFNGCSSLTELDLSSFDTSKVSLMANMFKDCVSLEHIYVSDKWDTGNIAVPAYAVFGNCVNLPNFDSAQTNISKAHYGEGGYLTYKAAPSDSGNNTNAIKIYTEENGWIKNGNTWEYTYSIPYDADISDWGEDPVPAGYELTSKTHEDGTEVYELTNTGMRNLTVNKTTVGNVAGNFDFEIKIWKDIQILSEEDRISVFDVEMAGEFEGSSLDYTEQKNKLLPANRSVNWIAGAVDNNVELQSYSNLKNASGVYKVTANGTKENDYFYVVVPGNIKRRGSINTADLAQINLYLRGQSLTYEDDFTMPLLDMNGNKTINVLDMSEINEIVVGSYNDTTQATSANDPTTAEYVRISSDGSYSTHSDGHPIFWMQNNGTSNINVNFSVYEDVREFYKPEGATPKTDENRDGIADDGIYTFSLSNNGSRSFTIPCGYKYEIVEKAQQGWQLVSVNGDTSKTKAEGSLVNDTAHTFRNSRLKKTVVVEKTWDDDSNAANKRASVLDITLVTDLNGTDVTRGRTDAVISKNDDKWTYTWTVDFDETVKTITETVPDNYIQTKAATYNEDTGVYEITNTLKKHSITVNKETNFDLDEEFDFLVEFEQMNPVFYETIVNLPGVTANMPTGDPPNIIGAKPIYYDYASVIKDSNGIIRVKSDAANHGHIDSVNPYIILQEDNSSGTTSYTLVDKTIFPDLQVEKILSSTADIFMYLSNGHILRFSKPYTGGTVVWLYMPSIFNFKLKGGDSLTIPGVPHDYIYITNELSDTGVKLNSGGNIYNGGVVNEAWTLKSVTGNARGRIANDDIDVTYKNEINLYDLEVTNNINGNMGDKEDSFSYTLTSNALKGKTIKMNGTEVTIPANGEYTFTLGHGGEALFSNIPYGSDIRVEQSAASSVDKGYTTKVNNVDTRVFETSKIVANTTAAYLNTRNGVIPTEIFIKNNLWWLIAAVSAGIIAFIFSLRHRKSTEQ